MWTLQDAKNRFSAVVDAALSGTPQEVTRRGRPAVVVMATAEYHRLIAGAAGGRASFADHLMDFPGDPGTALGDDVPDRAGAQPRDVVF